MIIQSFLEAGQKDALWNNWRARIVQIEDMNGGSAVIEELGRLTAYKEYVWGLIDREWRTESEIIDLTSQYPNLLVLPRVMIENYFIDPEELEMLCSNSTDYKNLDFSSVSSHTSNWVSNGAIWQTLYTRGADDFCQEDGYPKILRGNAVLTPTEIETLFRQWHLELNPETVMPDYINRLNTFTQQPENHYKHHIHGKKFFKQIIYDSILNRYRQAKIEVWIQGLADIMTSCPPDIAPILQRLFT